MECNNHQATPSILGCWKIGHSASLHQLPDDLGQEAHHVRGRARVAGPDRIPLPHINQDHPWERGKNHRGVLHSQMPTVSNFGGRIGCRHDAAARPKRGPSMANARPKQGPIEAQSRPNQGWRKAQARPKRGPSEANARPTYLVQILVLFQAAWDEDTSDAWECLLIVILGSMRKGMNGHGGWNRKPETGNRKPETGNRKPDEST